MGKIYIYIYNFYCLEQDTCPHELHFDESISPQTLESYIFKPSDYKQAFCFCSYKKVLAFLNEHFRYGSNKIASQWILAQCCFVVNTQAYYNSHIQFFWNKSPVFILPFISVIEWAKQGIYPRVEMPYCIGIIKVISRPWGYPLAYKNRIDSLW